MHNLKISIFILMATALFISCKKDGESVSIENNQELVVGKDFPEFENYRVCTEVHPSGTTARGATIKSTQWPNGSIIKVGMYRANATVKDKVILYAREWEKYANIKFDFVSTFSTADIRISFVLDGSSWSYLGTDAKQISSNYATMNFGWLKPRTAENEFSRVIIHEFGHALGMIHEHQHPLVSIPWDKPVVYDYYQKTQGWDFATIEHNLFTAYTKEETNYSSYDASSIMHYPVEEALTIGNYSVGYNRVLSPTDKTFIASVYPK